METWLPVPDFDGYAVSSLGRVKSFIGKTPRILKGSICSKGYHQVELRRLGRRYQPLVHQLVNLAFNGPPPTDWQTWDTHHKNGPANVPDNLEWQLHSEHWRHNRKPQRRRKAA